MSNRLVKITTIQEANEALRPYVPLVAQLTGKDTTLKRIRPLMKLLGNPEDKLCVIHIAGTSGKTSTAYYMSALLAQTGKQVGLTVSPHLDSITERVQINGQPISDMMFCQELTKFLPIVQQAPEPPSYFELLYAFAMWVFERAGVQYAVIETGMGGLFDATNIITRPDKVCIITDIGLDHTHILGNTLPEIAAQKIGIVHEQNVVFSYEQSADIMAVYTDWTTKQHATLHVTTEKAERKACRINITEIPNYQQHNWLLAYKVFRYLAERDSIEHLTSKALWKTLHTKIPGRMEVQEVQGKTIVMDGAHNSQKMTAFIESFKRQYPGVKPVVVIALKHDKEYKQVADILSKVAAHVITTTFDSTQDLPVHSMDPKDLAEAFNGQVPVQVIPDQRSAIRALMDTPEPIGIITGSFYLLSQVRNNIKSV